MQLHNDSCLTKSELGWTPGVHFLLLFKNSYHSPKETVWICSFPNFPVKIYLTALLPLVLLGPKLSGIHAQLLSQVQIFVTPWTVAHQTALSMGFPRQECWSGWLFPPAGDLPHLEVKPMSPALAGGFFATELPGKPKFSSIQKLMGMGLLMWEWGNMEKEARTKQVNSLT